MPMINKLSFTKFKSSLIDLLKGLCEQDTSFVEIWKILSQKLELLQRSKSSFWQEEKQVLIHKDQTKILGV